MKVFLLFVAIITVAFCVTGSMAEELIENDRTILQTQGSPASMQEEEAVDAENVMKSRQVDEAQETQETQEATQDEARRADGSSTEKVVRKRKFAGNGMGFMSPMH
eukprot:TRINITY_DN4018_c0_g1_i2.p1 TRINITY_DN4018_c0_g1~~TRINITY_DN4018_c0_g1_i2.p1  ORF type:complete len:106 (-),score=21.96 TRINITY_DN4018_c0_g1_i2:123-440(-)